MTRNRRAHRPCWSPGAKPTQATAASLPLARVAGVASFARERMPAVRVRSEISVSLNRSRFDAGDL